MVGPYYPEQTTRLGLENLNPIDPEVVGISAEDDGSGDFHESKVLRDSIILYGGVLVVVIFAYSWLRRRFPKVYNIRNWVEDLRTYLAEDQFQFFSWMWEVYMVTEDEIMEECGMDAVCFIRLIQMGYRLRYECIHLEQSLLLVSHFPYSQNVLFVRLYANVSIVSLFNMIWVLPVYFTAEESDETSSTTDVVVRTTVANVPPGSPRLYATVLAAYIMFGYAMYLIMEEFDWYIETRHKFLRKPLARHFTVFVRNVPPDYRSNQKLADFFRNCFSEDAVLEARLAIHAPSLGRIVAQRQLTVANLEHALAIFKIEGLRPRLNDNLMLLGETTDSIDYYTAQLEEQNRAVARRIEALEHILNETEPSPFQEPPSTPEPLSNEAEEEIHVHFDSLSQEEAPEDNGSYSHDNVSAEMDILISEETTTSSGKYLPTDWLMFPVSSLLLTLKNSVNTATHAASKATTVATRAAGLATNAASKAATQAVKTSAKSVAAVADIATAAANRAVTILLGEDGETYSAGFVVFKKLSSTNAALQMVHHGKPFAMAVMPACDPKDGTLCVCDPMCSPFP